MSEHKFWLALIVFVSNDGVEHDVDLVGLKPICPSPDQKIRPVVQQDGFS